MRFNFIQAYFRDRPLVEVLDHLSEETGISIIVDARVRQKAQLAITARFNRDVNLRDALRILTDMADLKVVILETGIYVTTPKRASVMEKELRKAKKASAVPTTSP